MNGNRLALLLSASLGLLAALDAAHALDQKEADKAVARFLSTQKSAQEDAQSQGSAVADLNGDGRPEIVLVWALLGPTYWRNTLTVLAQGAKGYAPAASLPLPGEATLASVRDGTILVDQKVPAKGDPICCPSREKQGKYRWLGNRLAEVK